MSTTDHLDNPADVVPAAARGGFVVGCDTTVGSGIALRWALALARRTGNRVTVISCWEMRDVWDETREEFGDGVPSHAELGTVAQKRPLPPSEQSQATARISAAKRYAVPRRPRS